MTAVAKIQPAIPALAMDEEELVAVLQSSLYPGASSGSIKLVVGYCRASKLDPMQKPVHIVPIYDAKAKAMRDVVMPGIGLYRTQAARSGQYAGVTEPEFGDDITESPDGVSVTYPRWCKVTVHRQMESGLIVAFTAKELWKENYATARRDTEAPNAMWKRRPYAQLAKCAEAQALRKAFPEFGAQPTADEMEGREINAEDIPQHPSSQQKAAGNAPSKELLDRCDEAAKKGQVALDELWPKLTREERQSLRSHTDRLKNIAAAADNTIDVPPSGDDFVRDMEAAEGAAA